MTDVHHIVLLLLVILDSVTGHFLVGPGEPIETTVGEDALLECQLVPDISASNMLVKWFKSGLDSPVHVYSHGEDDAAAQHRKYRGRTELLKNELTKGAISLRIKNTTIFDGGKYRCLVDSGTFSEETAVILNVRGLGHQPWIQMKGYHENGIQVVCKSSGWFPRPEIQWISEEGLILSQAEPSYEQDPNGLVNVQSIIVVTKQSTNRFKCVVQNKDLGITREAPIRISGLKLQKSFIECEWKRICDCKVSVTLDVETAHPELEVSEDLKSLRRTGTWRSLPDTEKRFTDSLCALGSEGFTSGRHYWEVEVGGNCWWCLGVASEFVERKRWVRLIPGNGLWTMERVEDRFYINSSPQFPLPDGLIPGKVGVYLSYESGTVSFYNVDTKSHLHTFTGNKFTGKLYPFFTVWDLNNFLRISC
ncbi:butyrophilin subfamily 1 member A1-like isoform X2 [Chiloscyllium punctatum]|uniref:butyrophilin subfamily 1 member A1-like isoform X2 n=1 Tax=Chiloscyllium punctatum TaxID=137246 RepID=UPI003B63DB66